WTWNEAIWSAPLPVLAISIGWMFTEMGRQPWLVFRLMPTAAGVSPGVGVFEVLTSLIAFTAIYAILAVVEFKLLLAAVKAGPVDEEAHDAKSELLPVAY
ncbi:MAG: hypothetical protein RL605_616, partial [Actinomycetota bacterium]